MKIEFSKDGIILRAENQAEQTQVEVVRLQAEKRGCENAGSGTVSVELKLVGKRSEPQVSAQYVKEGWMPCPFCGGEVEHFYQGSSDWEVTCKEPICSVAVIYTIRGEDEPEMARLHWNRRAEALRPMRALASCCSSHNPVM